MSYLYCKWSARNHHILRFVMRVARCACFGGIILRVWHHFATTGSLYHIWIYIMSFILNTSVLISMLLPSVSGLLTHHSFSKQEEMRVISSVYMHVQYKCGYVYVWHEAGIVFCPFILCCYSSCIGNICLLMMCPCHRCLSSVRRKRFLHTWPSTRSRSCAQHGWSRWLVHIMQPSQKLKWRRGMWLILV